MISESKARGIDTPDVSVANLTQLRDDYLFEARITYDGDLAQQKQWLISKYQELADDRSGGEVTNTAFDGSAANVQYRGSTPEERRQALRMAIEHLEALEADDLASAAAPRVFAIRFNQSPFYALDQKDEGLR